MTAFLMATDIHVLGQLQKKLRQTSRRGRQEGILFGNRPQNIQAIDHFGDFQRERLRRQVGDDRFAPDCSHRDKKHTHRIISQHCRAEYEQRHAYAERTSFRRSEPSSEHRIRFLQHAAGESRLATQRRAEISFSCQDCERRYSRCSCDGSFAGQTN